MGGQKVMLPAEVPGANPTGVIKPSQLVTISIPALWDRSILMAGYDHYDGSLRILDVGALRELEILAEKAHCLRKLDSRDAITATMPITSPVTTIVTATLTVPAAEVWFIGAITVTSPADTAGGGDILQCNFRVSRMVDQAATPSALGQLFWAANQGTAAAETFTAYFAGAEGLVWSAWGDAIPVEMLRLVAGDTVTLVATMTGVLAGAALASVLTPYGFGGKVLCND